VETGSTEKNTIYRPELANATDPRVVQTREAFRNALLTLLNTKALDQISVREIAKEAKVGYITFFRHYPTKESLLQEIASGEIDHLIELALPALGSSNVEAAALALCKYVAKNRDLWTTLLTGGAAHILKEEFIQRASKVALGRTSSDHWIPSDAAVAIVSSSTMEILTWWLKQRRPPPIKKVAKIYEKLVIEPVINAYS
jgi:AcrR family transcriptional regulator